MPTQKPVVNVLIASPRDVNDVRALVPPLLLEWNTIGNKPAALMPLMWEHATIPEMGQHPQDVINKQLIDRSDLLVAVFWTRIGTATVGHISGTIAEIETFKECKGPKRVAIYFIDKPINASPFDLDLTQIQLLKDYRSRIELEGLLCNVSDENALRLKLYQHLDAKVHQLLNGELPEPENGDQSDNESDELKWPCSMTIEDICLAFERYWQEMCQRGNKYRDEGARLAGRFALAIDSYLARNQFIISEPERHFLRERSHDLKKLQVGARSSYYRKAVPKQYWDDGKRIAEMLSVHAESRNHTRGR